MGSKVVFAQSNCVCVRQESVVHRDLALRNVLVFVLDPENVAVTSVKVSDFGLSVSMYGGIVVMWYLPAATLCNQGEHKQQT